MNQVFSPFSIQDVTFKNRIVMSPMCMYSCQNHDGKVNEWHKVHYGSRAAGQVGLIMLESTAVSPEGRIKLEDLGIWHDQHIEGLKELVDIIHSFGAKAGIQLAHAGRKSRTGGNIFAPSPIPYNEELPTPIAVESEKIQEIVKDFQLATKRASEAGFDVIEIHAAHGYLLHEFLSPLTNYRKDDYGGAQEQRFRFLDEVISSVRKAWKGPLFVRLSTDEYDEKGNDIEDYIYFVRRLKKAGVDLIDCSSGGIIPSKVKDFPGYQIHHALKIKEATQVLTGVVGHITEAYQADMIIKNQVADLIFVGRALLRNPYWVLDATKELGEVINVPKQYIRGWKL